MKHAVTAALVASLFAGTVAMADPPDRGYERGYSHDNHHDDRASYRDDRHDGRHDYRPDAHGRYHAGEYYRPHGYYYHTWRRGDRLPPAYRTRVYVVNNYSSYRLRHPPRGYHWVRVDNNVVLAAVTTGVVLEVVDNLFRETSHHRRSGAAPGRRRLTGCSAFAFARVGLGDANLTSIARRARIFMR
jgi:Ni/Co efflux regulator RcnB